MGQFGSGPGFDFDYGSGRVGSLILDMWMGSVGSGTTDPEQWTYGQFWPIYRQREILQGEQTLKYFLVTAL